MPPSSPYDISSLLEGLDGDDNYDNNNNNNNGLGCVHNDNDDPSDSDDDDEDDYTFSSNCERSVMTKDSLEQSRVMKKQLSTGITSSSSKSKKGGKKFLGSCTSTPTSATKSTKTTTTLTSSSGTSSTTNSFGSPTKKKKSPTTSSSSLSALNTHHTHPTTNNHTHLSLGAALEKVAKPSLKQKDFGRDEDDNDTFCGLGTVGEKELSKSPLKLSNASSPSKVKTVKRTQLNSKSTGSLMKSSNTSTKGGGGGGGYSMGNMMQPNNRSHSYSQKNYSQDDDSDDDESDDECNFFEKFDSNPFKMPSYMG